MTIKIKASSLWKLEIGHIHLVAICRDNKTCSNNWLKTVTKHNSHISTGWTKNYLAKYQ